MTLERGRARRFAHGCIDWPRLTPTAEEVSMKLLDFNLAPNPRKVRVYLKEKGIDLPIEQVDVMSGKNRTPEFLATVNPLGGLPILQLDDGSYLTESLAIIEYLEELHPTPSMLGSTAIERARVRETERIAEQAVLNSCGTIFQNTSPFFAGRVKQSADAAETARGRLATALGVLDKKIGSKTFLCGDKPTIADCTLFAAMELASFGQIAIDFPKLPNVSRWYETFKQRPSAGA
jgi:glutathione S-transferase